MAEAGHPGAGRRRAMGRRGLLGAGAAATAGAVLGSGPVAAEAAAGGRRPAAVTDSATPSGARALRTAEFGIVGVFDVDWLLEPRFTRLLDTLAASPGAFRAVRFFGSLNSGEREDTLPQGSGGVWRRRDEAPDFTVTLRALDALVSRGLVPFVGLNFFPAAVSPTPVGPPDLAAWAELVEAFLGAAVARFGADEVGRWRFEVWNEPNFRPFWSGSFDDYLALYKATSAAVARSGHPIRLGGPALVYTPGSDGPALMERFLRALADDPGLQCDFVSYHRKGVWTLEGDDPWIGGLAEAAEQVAEAVLRLAPARARGLEIVNDEADMKVGFDQPYEPRLTERFPAWLAAALIVHEGLSERYASHGISFLAAADDANQQLVRAPFDGRRSVMTRTSAAPDDLVKLPVYAFYELLPLLGGRRGTTVTMPGDAFFPRTDLLHLVAVGEEGVGALFTCCPERGGGPGWSLDYALRDIPWPRVNAVWFRIDGTRSNAFAAAGGTMPAPLDGGAAARRVRAAQELAVAAPLRSGLALEGGVFQDRLDLAPFATALLWVTPFSPDPPAAPAWLAAEAAGGNAVLRWTPAREAAFYTYEVFRLGVDGRPGPRLSPLPLRSAAWVDTAPPAGIHRYGVRAVTASGVASAVVPGPSVRV